MNKGNGRRYPEIWTRKEFLGGEYTIDFWGKVKEWGRGLSGKPPIGNECMPLPYHEGERDNGKGVNPMDAIEEMNVGFP